MPKREPFSLVGESLKVKIAGLSGNSFKLLVLLLGKIERKRNREPTEESNPFRLRYKDFKQYGIARTSFNSLLKVLEKEKYIRVWGKYSKKKCKILRW